ncbi:MAG: NfeD family protein [Endomicrobia bacterium]|nr:NfeD family protein [Endomicrobiia bacterium]
MKLLSSITVRSNVNNLIDKTGIVIEKIDGNKCMGLVKIENELWRAINVENKVIEKDKEIIVVKVEGVHLVVREK